MYSPGMGGHVRVAIGGSSSCSSKRESGEEERCIKQLESVIGLFSGLEYMEPRVPKFISFPFISHLHLYIL